MMLAPEDPLHVDHPLLNRHDVHDLDRHRSEPLAAEHAVLGGLKRDEDLLVRVLEAARGAFGAEYADDLEGYPADENGLVDQGRGVAAEHLGHRRAEYGVTLPGAVVAGGEHPAVRHRV